MKDEVVELEVEKVVFEGKALARMGRYVCFLNDGLPGERVLARVIKRKRQFAEARVEKVLVASPDRVASDCPLFPQCGGCTFRHCRYDAQLKLKQAVFLESMHGVPGVESVFGGITGMERPEFYRNKMVFSFGREDDRPVIGLHRRQDYRHILSTCNCLLQSPESNEIVRTMEAWALQSGFAVLDPETGQGILRDLMIREGKNTGQRLVQLTVTRFEPAMEEAARLLGSLCDTFMVGVDSHVQGPARPKEFHVVKGNGVITERVNGLEFEIGSETFFQTNTGQAEKMFAWIRQCAAELKPEVALDLYSGVGAIALHLASVAGRVIGVESNAASVASAEKNIRHNGLQGVDMLCAEVEKAPPGMLPQHADLVVVDPPRPGLHKKALERMVGMGPKRILYISCNPATLARDAALLIQGGYRLAHVHLIDMFPHTFHVESASILERI